MFTTLLLSLAFFGVCFVLLGVGFWIRGMALRGSCGGTAQVLGEDASCGVCAKKERELCPSEDDTGLLNISQIGNPHRTIRERDPGYRV